MGLLFAFILAIPMVSIISRVIYVQSNKNAKDSYSGNVEELTKQNNLNYGIIYKYEYVNEHTGQTNNTTGLIEVDYCSLTLETGTKYIRFNDNNGINMYDDNSTSIGSLSQINEVYYSVKQSNTTNLIQQPWFNNYQVNYVKGNLDNVFDYSISKLVDENNFGQLNFFEWFNNFLLNDSQNNLLYVRFANWYMNYAMLVSLMYVLFMCLMWFVNFARKLLERGMNYDW